MAHHKLTLTGVFIPRPNVATVETNLEFWNAADPTTGSASDNIYITNETKTFVEGKTAGQLLAELKIKIKEEAQGFINDFQQADSWFTSSALNNSISDIDGTLTS